MNNLEVEEDLSTMAALLWAEGVCMNRWERSGGRSCLRLGICSITWPQWHILLFEGQVAVVCPADCEEDASEASEDALLEEMGRLEGRNGSDTSCAAKEH